MPRIARPGAPPPAGTCQATETRKVCCTASIPPSTSAPGRPLYTPAERARRDATPWTLVQGILAPTQFLVFLISLGFVIHFLVTGRGETAANASILTKTCVLAIIMVTGSLWEKAVFGRYLFAPAFFLGGRGEHGRHRPAQPLCPPNSSQAAWTAAASWSWPLAAYASYLVNAAQFVFKLRAARRATPAWQPAAIDGFGHV